MSDRIRIDYADKDVARYDRGEVRGAAKRTDEGYVRAEAVVTRTGVFLYRNADGSIRRELRHPDDVFSRASLDSLRMIPITNGHPDVRLVNADNAKALQIGSVGETVFPDGRFVVASLQVTHRDGVTAIDGGRRELSLGYEVDLVHEDGEYGGERYDFRQTNIRYNHLALVDRARAGAAARINLDGRDAVETDPTETRTDAMDTKLKTISLDGIDYQAAPEVVNALEKIRARADASEAALKTLQADHDRLKADRDTIKAKLDGLESDEAKKARADEVAKAVKARAALERGATRVLKADDLKKLDEMSDRQVMEAVVKAKSPDAKLDGESDVYVRARFDAVIEALPAQKGSEALALQRQATATQAAHDTDDTVEGSRKRADEALKNAWKKPSSAKDAA